MSRIKGGKLTVIYDTTKRAPIDSRMLVTKHADLINPAIWLNTGTESTYNGMIVAVNNDGDYNGVYYLTDRTLLTEDNYNNYLAAVEAGTDLTVYFTMWVKLAKLGELTALVERITALEAGGVGGGITQDQLDQAIDDARTIRVNTTAELPSVGEKDYFYLCESDGITYVWSDTGFVKFAVREIKQIDGGNASTLY